MDDETVRCDICGEKIYEEDQRYEMPDGRIVCISADCLEEWASDYLRLGSHW